MYVPVVKPSVLEEGSAGYDISCLYICENKRNSSRVPVLRDKLI